jgi:hypothetical protein
MNFGEILVSQMNNPECSMITGVFMGEVFIVKWLFFLFIAIMVFQVVDKLAWLPFIEWMKKSLYKEDRLKRLLGKKKRK